MLWVRAFHIVGFVAWFAAIFYLPRLFVYHADTTDEISLKRFNIMERRLYRGIMWPAGIFTTAMGVWLILQSPGYYFQAGWCHAKLSCIVLLWAYHLGCGHYVRQFAQGQNQHRSRFYRFFNEVPTVLLIAIVVLVIVKPL